MRLGVESPRLACQSSANGLSARAHLDQTSPVVIAANVV
jgi:hypothetical protein